MYEPIVRVSPTPEKFHSLTRAEALDDEAPRGAWGVASRAHWLNWRCGIGLNAAREKVRGTHALKAAMDAQERDTESDDVTAETLADDDTDRRCELDDGQRLAPGTVRRIACDGSLLHITEDTLGNPLGIGRKPARWHRHCGGHCKRATVAAGFRAAVIDASSWIIPSDDLDYEIAIGGLLSRQQRRLPHETITA